MSDGAFKLLRYLLLCLAVLSPLQSVVSVADEHLSHQSALSGENSGILILAPFDVDDHLSDQHTADNEGIECQHCCLCHCAPHFFVLSINDLFPTMPYHYGLSDYVESYVSFYIAKDNPPPIV